MYKIITLAAAASLLTLAACNRDTETAPAVDTAANADAMSADTAARDASTSASASPSSTSARPSTATSGSETMAPADSSMAAPTDANVGPVSDQTRNNAKAEAESTNLHPRPPEQ